MVIRLKRILCPTDLSAESDEGLRYGVALARAYNAELELVYCGDVARDGKILSAGAAPINTNAVFEESLAQHLKPGEASRLGWQGIVVDYSGDPGEEIVRIAGEQRVDLIVMRSRRRPRAAALLGSTAERVYRTAPCPVLVTHPQEREWVNSATGEITLRKILVAHDFSNDSELALRHAVSLAKEYSAELHLLHVLGRPESDGPEVAWGPASIEAAYHAAARRLQQALPDNVDLGSNLVPTVRWGKTYQEVLTYAHEAEIDLICMGAKGKNFSMGALFGSNVDRVLRQAPCPVLVARPLRPDLYATPTAVDDGGPSVPAATGKGAQS